MTGARRRVGGARPAPTRHRVAPPSREPTGQHALQTLATVGSPIAILTALLVYFGWVRTDVQARDLGYDISLLDMSVQDYVLKSVNVLFAPLVLVALTAILLRLLHDRTVVAGAVDRAKRERLTRWIRLLRHSWPLWLAVGALLVTAGRPYDGFAPPVVLAAVLGCLRYANVLRARLTPSGPPSAVGRVLVAFLLGLSVFWITDRAARALGSAYAADTAAAPETLAAVTVFSAKDLAISGPGITVARLDNPDAAYLYRYDGLRLLQRSGGRYLLIGLSGDPAHARVFVIQENPTIRLQFSR